jgi:UDP-galactopyranose mutase
MFDVVIVGAGFAGAVLAQKLSVEKTKKVLVVEKRRHIGGNCFDYRNNSGVHIHAYGPHLFHTSNSEVFQYLSRFTEWQEYQHRVLASIDGQRVPVPFNLTSLHQLFPQSMAHSLEKKLVEHFGFGEKVPILELTKVDDPELKELAEFIYQKVFLHYTTKQWGCAPEEISKEVMGRVPVYVSWDDRYFQDRYQVVPKGGYTNLIDNLLDNSKIHLLLNTDYKDILTFDHESGEVTLLGAKFKGEFIFSGMIDELFDFRYGSLPYRTLDFQFETLEKVQFQEVATVNYPNDYNFTRITEFKHIHDQELQHTTILREYPRDYKGVNEEADTPCYPVFNDENTERYSKYLQLADTLDKLTLIGRLAEYKYYDMDDIVARALEVFDEKFA